ncbi:Actin, muscle, partial [Reticulomyxa filosa]
RFIHEYAKLNCPEYYNKGIIDEITSYTLPFAVCETYTLPDEEELEICSYTHPRMQRQWKEQEEEKEEKTHSNKAKRHKNKTKSNGSKGGTDSIMLSYERFEPCEILFQPWRYYQAQSLHESGFSSYLQKNLIGLDSLIMQTYFKSNQVSHKYNVVLSGGNMLLPGVAQRLHHELTIKHKHSHSNLHGGAPSVIHSHEPHFLPYVGAELLMNLDLFNLSSSREWI